MNKNQSSQIIIYNTEDGKSQVNLYARDGNIWLNQKQITELFDTSLPNINMHISAILKEKELEQNSVIKYFLTTAIDGKNYNVVHYNLEMIMAIGFRVRGKRGTQFRIWANQNLAQYLIKGFLMDDESLKDPRKIFGKNYFNEQLAWIRDITSSERRFYQKITDIYSQCSIDYDKNSQETKEFFATT
jgi:hypothetical protein